MFVAMAGLPASGKSTLAKALKQRISAVVLDKDSVREFLFGQYTDYTREQDDLCMRTIYATACYLAKQNPTLHIILDGRTYSRRYQIKALEMAAKEAGTELKLIECVCSSATARKRLQESSDNHPAADRDYAMYLRSKAASDPITRSKLILDTDALTLSVCTDTALQFLESDA